MFFNNKPKYRIDVKSQQNVEAEKQGTLFKKKRREMSTAERVGMLQEKLYCKAKQQRYYKRKSQRRSRLYGTQAFDLLVYKYGLIDPTKYQVKG